MKENKRLLAGILIGALVSGISVYFFLNNRFKTETESQLHQIAQQAGLLDSVRNSGLAILMKNALENIDTDLNENQSRSLTDETIARITTVCYSARPYASPADDPISASKVSPERGQLLLLISGLNIDTVSLQQVFSKASFAGADLRGADLSKTDLRGANLKGADLRDAILEGAQLQAADLSFANLWGANLRNANLNGTQLRRADLSWADLNGAVLRQADLKEADLVSAQLRKTDLSGCVLQWANFNGAFLTEADLSGADMFRTVMKKAHLVKANFTGATMNYTNLSEADLSEADLTGADLTNLIIIEQQWLRLLDQWKVSGAAEIQRTYEVVKGNSREESIYQLRKK